MLRQIDRDVMCMREYLLAHPLDHGARGVLADALDEAGCPGAAWRHRWLAVNLRQPERRETKTRVQRWSWYWLQGHAAEADWAMRASRELLPAAVFAALPGGILANSRYRGRHRRFYAGPLSAMTALLMALRDAGTLFGEGG